MVWDIAGNDEADYTKLAMQSFSWKGESR